MGLGEEQESLVPESEREFQNLKEDKDGISKPFSALLAVAVASHQMTQTLASHTRTPGRTVKYSMPFSPGMKSLLFKSEIKQNLPIWKSNSTVCSLRSLH